MNKSELIDHIATEAGLNKTQAGDALSAVISGITKTLKKGGTVSLIGFGGFGIVKRKARLGRNPATGEPLKIKASKAVKFTVGKALKDAVK